MEYNLPHRISSEKDLSYYEQYIESEKNLLNSGCNKPLSCELESKNNIPTQTKNQKIKIIDKKSSYHENNMIYWDNYLKNHIGKLVKVESLVCERLESRMGILMAVGIDYVVIKPNRNCCSMIISSQSIKYITIIHNNMGISKY